MSDRMRWRYGDTNPVVAAVDPGTVIEIGDLVYQAVDNARPAAAQSDQGTPADNQTLFAANFLGVAMQRSRAGQAEPIRVATTGVFEFDIASGGFELGDLVGASENSNGTALENQVVEKVGAADRAIARIARRAPAGTTSVLVDIRSTVMTGGV